MVLSPERRIELNPYDVDAWNLLLRESQVIYFYPKLFINKLRHDPLIKFVHFTKGLLANSTMPVDFGKHTSNMN
jgi:hypothetical protein